MGFFESEDLALSAAGDVHPLEAGQAMAFAALMACLLLVAEGIARLRGNRGATCQPEQLA